MSSRSTSRRKGNEKQLWLRLNRECHFGNAGNMEPCSSKKCVLCSLIRSSVSKEIVQHGVLRPSSLARYLFYLKARDPILTEFAEPLRCPRRFAKRPPRSSCWRMSYSVEKSRCQKKNLSLLMNCGHMDTTPWVVSFSRIPNGSWSFFGRYVLFVTECCLVERQMGKNHSSSILMRLNHYISSPTSEW